MLLVHKSWEEKPVPSIPMNVFSSLYSRCWKIKHTTSVWWPSWPPHPRLTFSLSPAAGDPAGGQAAAQRGRLPDQGRLRLLGEEAQELPGALAHPADQAGEEGWLHQQRPLRGLPQEDWEDADQKGDLAASAACNFTFLDCMEPYPSSYRDNSPSVRFLSCNSEHTHNLLGWEFPFLVGKG